MQAYMDEGLPGLEDAGPTIEFITRINDLVEAMNSQVPEQGLRPNPNSKYHKVSLNGEDIRLKTGVNTRQ